jgi:thymidylate kinase
MACSSKIITLLGFDGCGKSSILKRLESNGIATSSWQKLRDIPELQFMKKAATYPRRYRERLPPYSRAAFLMLSLFAEYEFVIEPALESKQLVVVDSYYLRPMAKEMIKGKCSEAVLQTAKLLPPPSAVIVFDVTPEEAYRRKKRPSPNEVFDSQTFPDFSRFQQRVLGVALNLVDPCIVYHIDANHSVEHSYKQVTEILRRFQ